MIDLQIRCCEVRPTSASKKGKGKVRIVSIILSQLCDPRVGAYLRLHGPEPAVSAVMRAVGHTSPIHCCYFTSI